MSRRPGCLLFLLQGSAGMDPLSLCAARLHIDQALDALLRRPQRNATLEVGVIGYNGSKDRVAFVPLLPDVKHSTDLVPLLSLASVERRQVLLDRLTCRGRVSAAEGLAHAHLIVQRWLADHPDARPPVVMHLGESRGYGPAHARLSRSLRLLGPASGAVGLAHHILAPDLDLRLLGEVNRGVPRKLRRVWKHSSPVVLTEQEVGFHSTRALAVNRDPRPILQGLLRQRRPLRSTESPCPARMRVLTLARRGRTEDENEDALGCNASHGLAVVSDGAGEGVFSREWAGVLVNSYLNEKPDPADRRQFTAWLGRCRLAWLERMRLQVDSPAGQIEAERKGTAGTFLAWQLSRLADGSLAWQGWAVGDSCLFWVRNNRLRASFPLAHSRHFVAAPTLLATIPRKREPGPLYGAGVCKPGDLFVLATDAMARYLLLAVERGREPDWNELETVSEEQWRSRTDALRDGKLLVNDDSTLVLARVHR